MTALSRWMVNASRARGPLLNRAVRLAVRVLVGIGLLVVLALMVGGAWLVWTMGGVE